VSGQTRLKTHRILEALDDAQVRILSLTAAGGVQDLSKDAPGSTAIRGALSLGAALEGEQIADRARRGAESKINRGMYVGGQRPLGYLQPPGEGLKPHPTEAPIVREIFERYANGESLRALAADLDQRGIKRPNGGHWSASRIAETLDAGIDIGEVAPGTRGRHEPLVDDALWSRVRSLRDAKAELHPRGGRHPREHLLTGGMLRCGGPTGCGQSFYARAYGRSVATYRCRGKDGYNGPKTECGTPAIPQPFVDDAVREIVARLEDPRATAREVEDTVKQRAAQARKDAKAAASEVAKFGRRLESARTKFLDDAFSRTEYEQLRVELEAELAAARQRQAEAEALARDLTTNGHDHAEAIKAARELAKNEAPSPEERDRYRAFLETHFKHFAVAIHPVSPELADAERAEAKGLLDSKPVGEMSESERELVERYIAEHQLRELDAAMPYAARFGPWRSRGRGMVAGVLIAEWAPEYEARFAVEHGQQPTLSLGDLR
jgi:hypothetical protein